MLPVHIQNADHVFGKPANWDDATMGQCVALYIKRETINQVEYLTSLWEPSLQEYEAIRRGAKIKLLICGPVHPVVALEVGEIPQ